MLAADLRFPKPKLLKREFIELIGNGGEGGEGGEEEGRRLKKAKQRTRLLMGLERLREVREDAGMVDVLRYRGAR